MTNNCTLAYAIQLSNQPLINLFVQTYSGPAGQQAWLQIPSNRVLIAEGNSAEVSARWNVLLLGIENSVVPTTGTVCSTNLGNQLALHDLLLLSLLPATYQSTTCAIAQASVTSGNVPVVITNTNGTTGTRNTTVVPPSNQLSSTIPRLNPVPPSTQTTTLSTSQIQSLFSSLNSPQFGFSGTLSNQTLFS